MEAASRLKKLRKDPFAATPLRDLSSEFKSPEERVEQYRQIDTTPSTTSKRKYLVPKIFVHNSVEAQIKAQLDDINGSTLFPESPQPQRPRTFAEATMSTRRGRRTKNEYDPPSTRPKALGQVGIFKVATNKKSGKWIPLEYSTPESASASASTSDVEVDDPVSPRLSRRSSLNPTANEFELPLPNQPYEPAHLILSSIPHPSDSYNAEDCKGKGIDRGEEQYFQIGATSAGRATGISAGYYPEHLFGVDILAREDEEYCNNFYQGDATYLKHTPGYPEIEGRVENYHQESQRSEHDDLRSWALTTVVDTDPEFTPKFTQFSAPASISPGFGSVPDVSPQRFFPSVPLSTKPSKTEPDQAMGHFSNSTTSKHILKPGEDAFDSLEWDPNLPTATSPDSSPEPVPIKPQPVAYTTVGSLVNPKNVPQFSAPNRIQREGANRRPLMSLLSTSRQYDNVLQPRGPPPPLSMANSMHYAQQIARSPVHLTVPSSTNSARSPRSTSTKNIPNRLDEAMLMRQLLGKEPQELSGNAREATGSPNASKKYSSSATIPSRQLFSIKELIEEEQHIRSSSVPGLVQGLEKMQTLQRLAKFANPMQELARNRLAEFSLLKSQNTGKTIANPTGISAQEMLLSSQIGMSSKMSATANGDGELDRGFRFPPPGLSGARTTQVNTFNASSSTNFSQTTSASVRTGYPEPLTAGPPGQRQYNQSVSQPPTNYQELWSTEYGSQPYNAYDSGTISSLWSNQYAGQVTTQPEFFQSHSGHVKSKLVDTIDPNTLSKYYSAGYPTDMTGYYQPVSEENVRLMVEGPSKLLPKEARDARREEATTTWYFNGQRRYNLMTPDDYMKELEVAKDYYEEKQTNPFGAIGPPKKKILPPVEPKPLSEEEIKKKPITELVPPALESSWGALAGYSANNVPGSNSDLSRLMNPPDWQIDPENEGNKSYFGEDWGKPPKGSTPISWND